MQLTLTNTLSGKKETFVPADPNRVTMYVCGPTVYNDPHIGNARPAVVFDTLFRLLREVYPKVVYARNITDVDDKINAKAAAEGIDIGTLTARYAAVYHEDMTDLGVLPPDVEPKVTQTMPEIIAMISGLIESGFAYEAEGHVLFHVPAFPGYGRLSGRSQEELLAGARVEVAPYKRDASDFVLWKPSGPDLPGWESPWGRGRPGWHIECSAMIQTHLGETIDIHGGGFDLIFPHHENEIAQSECAHHGAPLARYWVHNAFLNVHQQKMSKSVGNVLLVSELRKEAPGEAIRYALLATHYHHPLQWSDETLPQSKTALDRLYRALQQVEDADLSSEAPTTPAEVLEALADDVNTPRAFAALHGIAKEANKAVTPAEKRAAKARLLGAGQVLGLLRQSSADWFAWRPSAAEQAAFVAQVEDLIARRIAARKAKNWAEADALRDALTDLGVVIMDGDGGTSWRMV